MHVAITRPLFILQTAPQYLLIPATSTISKRRRKCKSNQLYKIILKHNLISQEKENHTHLLFTCKPSGLQGGVFTEHRVFWEFHHQAHFLVIFPEFFPHFATLHFLIILQKNELFFFAFRLIGSLALQQLNFTQ